MIGSEYNVSFPSGLANWFWLCCLPSLFVYSLFGREAELCIFLQFFSIIATLGVKTFVLNCGDTQLVKQDPGVGHFTRCLSTLWFTSQPLAFFFSSFFTHTSWHYTQGLREVEFALRALGFFYRLWGLQRRRTKFTHACLAKIFYLTGQETRIQSPKQPELSLIQLQRELGHRSWWKTGIGWMGRKKDKALLEKKNV